MRWYKHLAIRLWTSLTIGSLFALMVLPPFAGAIGPDWMIVPGLVMLMIAFWVTGMVFAAMGRRRLERLLGEAAVWDRAGMAREARQALSRAVATVDSFFFSPMSRKIPADRLLAQMAQFQLAQTAPEPSTDAVVGAYLNHFPGDRNAAVKWLDGVLAGRTLSQQSHEIAVGIGAAHSNDLTIQQKLAQFYLAERRCDFAALQTYQHVMDGEAQLNNDLLRDIADLFALQSRADNLALKVYLGAYERGHGDPRLLSGIAACRRSIHSSPEVQPLLQRADAALAGIDAADCNRLANDFMPEIPAASPSPRIKRPRIELPAVGPIIHNILVRSTGLASTLAAVSRHLWRNARSWISSKAAKLTLKWAGLGLLIMGLAWLVINTAMHLTVISKTAEPMPEPVVAPITDPFTLQVAAYLKEADARRYVDQLTAQGLDAYWTRATGSSKTWFQVRISHFKTKAEARAFGEDLKARRLIGDYYVANYKRPDVP